MLEAVQGEGLGLGWWDDGRRDRLELKWLHPRCRICVGRRCRWGRKSDGLDEGTLGQRDVSGMLQRVVGGSGVDERRRKGAFNDDGFGQVDAGWWIDLFRRRSGCGCGCRRLCLDVTPRGTSARSGCLTLRLLIAGLFDDRSEFAFWFAACHCARGLWSSVREVGLLFPSPVNSAVSR